jgi:hypothetical protein
MMYGISKRYYRKTQRGSKLENVLRVTIWDLCSLGPGGVLGWRKLAHLFSLSQFTPAHDLMQIIYSKGAQVA